MLQLPVLRAPVSHAVVSHAVVSHAVVSGVLKSSNEGPHIAAGLLPDVAST